MSEGKITAADVIKEALGKAEAAGELAKARKYKEELTAAARTQTEGGLLSQLSTDIQHNGGRGVEKIMAAYGRRIVDRDPD